MKPSKFFPTVRATVLVLSLAVVMCCPSVALAQSAAVADSAGTSGQQRADAMAEAKRLAMSGDVPAAERLLRRWVTDHPGTAEWHLACARELMQLVLSLRVEKQFGSMQIVAATTLDHLEKAKAKAGDADIIASAEYMEGVLYERCLMDHVRAKASYRAAATANPRSSALREANARLQRVDDEANLHLSPQH